jgi:hypothetical protein
VSATTPALEPLLTHFAQLLADALAPTLAAHLAAQAAPPPAAAELPTRRLLTLDELVAQLPAGKSPATWKRWLYERTRHGAVPGCHKIGGRLFFDPEHTIPWLTAPCPDPLDVSAEESLHEPTITDIDAETRTRGSR